MMISQFSYKLALSALLLVFYTACSREEQKEQSALSESFAVFNPSLIDTVFERSYVADIQAVKHIELRSRVDGFLEKIHVDEGQDVREGQLLFTINNKMLLEELRRVQAALNSAIAEVRITEVETENTRLLVSKNVVGEPELKMLEAKLEVLNAKVEEARAAVSAVRLNLSFTEIRAPFAGVINREPLKSGSLISDGDLLTTLSDNHDIYVYFNVSEKDYLKQRTMDRKHGKSQVTLQLANGEMHPYRGELETSESVVDRQTGSIAFRARFRNPQNVLKHGSSGKILLKEELSGVITIPQKSTFEVQDKYYVYVVNSEGNAERRAFIPKLRLGDLYVVEAGLSEKDRVIYEGIQKVREGEKIDWHELGK